MKLRIQVCLSSWCREYGKGDIYKDAYASIYNFLSLLKEDVFYTSRKRTYISKKTGEVKEYFSDRQVNIGEYKWDVDLLFPGGPLINLELIDGSSKFSGRRFSILKKILYEKAEESGVAISILPFYNSPIKKKIIGEGEEIYRNTDKLSDTDFSQKVEKYLIFVDNSREYVSSIPHIVYVINHINYLFKLIYGKGVDPFFVKGEPYEEMKKLFAKYISTREESVLSKFFLLMHPSYVVFKTFSQYYCLEEFDEGFLTEYLGFPYLEREEEQIVIRKKLKQVLETSKNVTQESGGIYSVLRKIFLYLMSISSSFKDFKENLLKVFSKVRLNKYYFTFSFRSLSDISISFRSIGFSSLDEIKNKISKTSLDSVLLIDGSLSKLLDECEYLLISRFL